jgi:hypothetical protein
MTFEEGLAALQVIAEETYGVPMREAQAREDARFDRSLDALRREQQERI